MDEPRVGNQLPHPLGTFVNRTEFFPQRFLQGFERLPKGVGDPILDHIPDHFHRIEFWTVGWQGQQMDVCRHLVKLGRRVKARLIPDHHVLGLRIACGQALQKQAAQFQAHTGQARKLRRVLAIDFQRAVEVTPLILGLIYGAVGRTPRNVQHRRTTGIRP